MSADHNVRIETSGFNFDDALSKIHLCTPKPAISINFRSERWQDTPLPGAIVSVLEEPVPKVFESMADAMAYVVEWMDKRTAFVNERTKQVDGTAQKSGN